jgi:hypothetical protein
MSRDYDYINEQIDFSEYVKKLDTYKLIEIIEALEDYEEVSAALTELSARDKNRMLELGNNILSKELGDKYLQGFTFSLVYGCEPKKALEIIGQKIDKVDPIMLRDIMDELATDCFQDIAKEIPDKLLMEIKDRYMKLTKDSKEYISEEYERFERAYKDRLR